MIGDGNVAVWIVQTKLVPSGIQTEEASVTKQLFTFSGSYLFGVRSTIQISSLAFNAWNTSAFARFERIIIFPSSSEITLDVSMLALLLFVAPVFVLRGVEALPGTPPSAIKRSLSFSAISWYCSLSFSESAFHLLPISFASSPNGRSSSVPLISLQKN